PSLDPGHSRRPQEPSLRRDAKERVRRAVAGIAAPALDDLEEEPLAHRPAVQLKILALALAVIEQVRSPQPVGEIGIEAESRLEIVVIVARDRQGLEPQPRKPVTGGKDIVGRKGQMLDAGAEALGHEAPGERAA